MSSSAATQSRKPAARRKGGGGVGFFAVLFLVVVPGAVFAAPTTLMFGAGLIPSFVAWITDRDAEKSAGITVSVMNICGILPFTMDLWRHTHTVPEAMRMLGDPVTWLVMYGAAAVGWAFFFMVPPMVTSFEVARHRSRIETLQNKKRDLIEEWGPEVATADDEAPQAKARVSPGSAAASARS